jgi:hypothetical protein
MLRAARGRFARADLGEEMSMRRVILGMCLVAMVASTAAAQEGKRVALGVGITEHSYSDGAFSQKNPGISFIYRLRLHTTTKDGWSWEPTAGLGWFTADTQMPIGSLSTHLGRVRSRPFMGGVSRSYRQGPMAIGFSVQGGPSFNHFSPDNAAIQAAYSAQPVLGTLATYSVKTSTSFALKPEAGIYYDLGKRFALHGSLSYMYNKPTAATTVNGTVTSTKWNTSHTNIQIGLVVGIF